MGVHDLLAQAHRLSVVDFTATVHAFSEPLVEGRWHRSATARTCCTALKLATLGHKSFGD